MIPLTRSLIERVGSLEAEKVLPYLKRELRWVIETVGTPFSPQIALGGKMGNSLSSRVG